MIYESLACRNAALTGRLDFIKSGTGTAYLHLYSGTRPDSADTTVNNNNILVSIPFDTNPGSITDGVLSLSFVPTVTVRASGTATWGRVVSKANQTVFDLSIGKVGSIADCFLNDTDLHAGGNVTVISAELR